jgi:hypothetical protein
VAEVNEFRNATQLSLGLTRNVRGHVQKCHFTSVRHPTVQVWHQTRARLPVQAHSIPAPKTIHGFIARCCRKPGVRPIPGLEVTVCQPGKDLVDVTSDIWDDANTETVTIFDETSIRGSTDKNVDPQRGQPIQPFRVARLFRADDVLLRGPTINDLGHEDRTRIPESW